MCVVTAAAAGAVLMSLELAAFRLYAPYFGYSIYVWGSMISIVMAALAAGYSLGGRLADRAHSDGPLYAVMLFSAAHQFVILFTARLFLPALARYGDFTGVAIATVIVFAPSMAALAAVGPVAVRACSRADAIGSAAGRVYALSTAGSMAGILATSFVLLPRVGTDATLRILCAATFLLSVPAFARRRGIAAACFLPIACVSNLPGLDWSRGAVWSAESAYNLVRVVQRGSERVLLLNNNGSVHSVRAETGLTGYYYDAFALGPLVAPAHRMLVLGMGGGASIHATRMTAPDIDIDAVEIDSKVVEAAARWFDITASDRLRIHNDDARRWLARNQGAYDLLEVDLYQGGPYIPFYLATEEFFRLVSVHMTRHGAVMMNVFDAGPKRELLFAIAATLKRVFPSVMVVRTQDANYMLFAFTRTRLAASVRESLWNAPAGLDRYREITAVDPPEGTRWFTDDCAPIEEVTRRMLRSAVER